MRGLKQCLRAADVRRMDLLLAGQGQRRRAVNHFVDAGHCALDGGGIANVRLHDLHLIPFGVLERRNVHGPDREAARQQVTAQIDAEKARPAGD